MATKLWQLTSALLSVATVFLAQNVAVAEPPPPRQAASYWIMTEQNRTRLVANQMAFNSQQPTSQVLSSAFGQLLNNKEFARQHSAIPQNTKLLSLRVGSDSVYVDLSREFLQGGGSASLINRLTQVIYTATSLRPNALVYLSVEGQILNDHHPIAGEGMMVRYPVSRQQLAEDFPLH